MFIKITHYDTAHQPADIYTYLLNTQNIINASTCTIVYNIICHLTYSIRVPQFLKSSN